MRDYVWAVQVTAMPEGSVLEDGSFNPGWQPENWGEERASLKRAGIMRPEETDFFWPAMDKIYMSRSTAKKRVQLLERYGATASVVRSPLRWETTDGEPVDVYAHFDDRGIYRMHHELVKEQP